MRHVSLGGLITCFPIKRPWIHFWLGQYFWITICLPLPWVPLSQYIPPFPAKYQTTRASSCSLLCEVHAALAMCVPHQQHWLFLSSGLRIRLPPSNRELTGSILGWDDFAIHQLNYPCFPATLLESPQPYDDQAECYLRPSHFWLPMSSLKVGGQNSYVGWWICISHQPRKSFWFIRMLILSPVSMVSPLQSLIRWCFCQSSPHGSPQERTIAQLTCFCMNKGIWHLAASSVHVSGFRSPILFLFQWTILYVSGQRFLHWNQYARQCLNTPDVDVICRP